MLSCEEVKNLLSAYYDGELGVAAQQQVAEHLSSCEACREELAQMKALSKAFGTLAFPVADKAFRADLHERLAAEAKKNKTFRVPLWKDMRAYATVAACLVLTVGIYAAVGNHSLDIDPVPQPSTVDVAGTTPTPPHDASAPVQPDRTIVPPGDTEGKTAQQDTDRPGTVQPVVTVPPQENEGGEATPTAAPTVKPDVITPAEPTEVPQQTADPRIDTHDGEINTGAETPRSTEVPNAGSDEPEPNANAGGGTPSTTSEDNRAVVTVFKLTDTQISDRVADMLKSFGTVIVSETSIEAKVLNTNYDACLSAMRSVEGLVEVSSITKEDDSSGHCYIQIHIAQ